MKKKVKQYANQIESGALERRYVMKDFSRMLDMQVISISKIIDIVSKEIFFL